MITSTRLSYGMRFGGGVAQGSGGACGSRMARPACRFVLIVHAWLMSPSCTRVIALMQIMAMRPTRSPYSTMVASFKKLTVTPVLAWASAAACWKVIPAREILLDDERGGKEAAE